MIRSVCVLLPLTILTSFSKAQTGPAGVDNSTNNVLWLKANAGTNTTTSGVTVSSWLDQSGNGNHVTQATATQQPLFQNGVINGFPAILFDNSTVNNDKLIGSDSPTLDNTSGVTIFTVSHPTGLDGNARTIVSKRNNVSVDESYMFFYYTGNRLYTDIQTTDNRFNTVGVTGVFSNNNTYLLDLQYNGAVGAATRSRVYINGNLNIVAAETNASIPDNPSPLLIGSTHTTDNRPFGGYIAEVIIYRKSLNDAERNIVDNYLSAKYGIALAGGNLYDGDLTANGDYDIDVCGIGTDVTGGSNASFSSERCAGLEMVLKSGFGNGDFILAGHRITTTNILNTTDVAGIPGISPARWLRDWYWDVTDNGLPATADITFDISDAGMGTTTAATAADYKLVYRAGTSGPWTVVATASSVSGDRITFADFTPANDGVYTIATVNWAASPLPIELTSFDAEYNNMVVDVTWTTATEINNDYFTVEKSFDGINFEEVARVRGAGNSNHTITYTATDNEPSCGKIYYRLRQTDFNGDYTFSDIKPVYCEMDNTVMRIAPNPVEAGHAVKIYLPCGVVGDFNWSISNTQGAIVQSGYVNVEEENTVITLGSIQQLTSGYYLFTLSGSRSEQSCPLVFK